MILAKSKTLFIFITMVIIFLNTPVVVAAADKESVESKDISHSSAFGEWNPRKDGDEPALYINEPMYFIVGKHDRDTKARFQVSLKYRLFDRDGIVVNKIPWLEKLHFAYTQTSLWNLSSNSTAFEDTSYRPSCFWEFQNIQMKKMPDFLRLGYEHESNGQGGEKSRGINTLFIFPAWTMPMGSMDLTIGTKVYVYISRDSENSDIEKYRGYADLIVRYGREDSWLIAAMWRYGIDNKNTIQLDLSYPIRKKIFARTGGYFYIQSFYGYGETLLTYNQKQDINVRFGFAVVR